MAISWQYVAILAVLFLDKVDVVCSDNLDIVLPCELDKYRIDLLLFGVRIVGCIGFVSLVALQLEVEIVAKESFEPQHCFFGSSNVSFQDFLRYLASDTCRTAYYALVVLLQQVMVDTWRVEISVRECYRTEFAQVPVACLVFGKQNQVPSAAVCNTFASRFGVALLDVGIFVVECAVCTVGLDSDNRLEKLRFERSDLRISRIDTFLNVA